MSTDDIYIQLLFVWLFCTWKAYYVYDIIKDTSLYVCTNHLLKQNEYGIYVLNRKDLMVYLYTNITENTVKVNFCIQQYRVKLYHY